MKRAYVAIPLDRSIIVTPRKADLAAKSHVLAGPVPTFTTPSFVAQPDRSKRLWRVSIHR
jgi:hypothetical protein